MRSRETIWTFIFPIIVQAKSNVQSEAAEHVPLWQTLVPDISFVRPLAKWRVYSEDYQRNGSSESEDRINVSAAVPGDLLSDLMDASLIDDPYFDRNFLTQKHVYMGPRRNESDRERTRTWIYSTRFSIPSQTAHHNASYFLVAESIKMGAHIGVNGIPVGIASNQFRRYLFRISQAIIEKGSRLTIANGSDHLEISVEVKFDPTIHTDGRFMACSGGWDWAPYAQSVDARGSRIMSLGMPRPMYLVAVRHAMIIDVVPHVHYLGDFPTKPMWGGPEGDFVVYVKVYIELLNPLAKSTYRVFVNMETLASPIFVPLSDHDGEKVTINVTFIKDDVELWWPNGMGNQKLYWLDVAIDDGICLHNENCVTKRQWIGFRTVALVTANDTDPTVLADMQKNSRQGSASHGMYFRVNGAILWARGANFVPMDQLEGRLSDEGHEELVRSAARAGMNMLRVWGGGSIPPESFYRACDEYGILLYHDLMFVEEGQHGAIETREIHEEIRHTVRQLATHPSIVLWNGCNECSGHASDMAIYDSFVMTLVAKEDDSRPIWASSPSPYGWRHGVRMLDGKPNGDRLLVRPWNETVIAPIEAHGPYQRGYSVTYPAVNGRRSTISEETLVPPTIHPSEDSGAGYRNIFVSEFGATGFSSFESMAATLMESTWSVHGGNGPDTCQQVYENENACLGNNTMAERNYPCDNRIEIYFGTKTYLDGIGAASFRRQLYECMIAQALWMKGKLEMMRATNSFGTLIWQLNENWPTGGWGCVEYGPRKGLHGQVVGGRWKPLMYLLSRRLFRERIVACGKEGQCFSRDDSYNASVTQVIIEAWSLGRNESIRTFTWQAAHRPGRSIVYFQLPIDFQLGADVCLLTIPGRRSDHELLVDSDAFLWRVPRDLSQLDRAVTIHIQLTISAASETVYLSLMSDRLALYVWLTTAAYGHFSDNAFHLRPHSPSRISFDKLPSDESLDVALFTRTLRLDHLGSTTNLVIQVTKHTATN